MIPWRISSTNNEYISGAFLCILQAQLNNLTKLTNIIIAHKYKTTEEESILSCDTGKTKIMTQ